MPSARTSSLQTALFKNLYRSTSVMCWILFIIYFELNAEVLQGNAAVLSILHSRKGMITSGGNFHETITEELC